MNILGELLEIVLGSWRKFYGCLLLSFAISGFVLSVVPPRNWSVTIAIATVVIGIVAGVVWERRS
jgi:hypothetical protein